ncbi:PIN domain-containing protein [Phenylobacterium sp.]|uniref:PIN domain-containing protein n=1 Tax=Phenylobacterium sp. TaxID=1871053 RepID=UPI0025EEE8CA|nr:PIN domain-containing protein [Phenylobacterium sp.]MBX3483319.1 PIN domain-containing protein [Phenylobacterium sp.]
MSRAFFDTNILLYVTDSDRQKATRSIDVLAAGGVISVQVLNEFVSVARGKLSLSWDELEPILKNFAARFHVEAMTLETQMRATVIARRHLLNIYDATIIAAAEQAGCDVLYTEDLQHGATIAGVEIRNPY